MSLRLDEVTRQQPSFFGMASFQAVNMGSV